VCLCLSVFLRIEIQLIEYTQHKRHTYFCFSLMMEAEADFETFRVWITNMKKKTKSNLNNTSLSETFRLRFCIFSFVNPNF
jgi:hypothetical protein